MLIKTTYSKENAFHSMLGELESIKSKLEKLKAKQEERMQNLQNIQEKFPKTPKNFHIGNGDFQDFSLIEELTEPSTNWNSLSDHLKLKCINFLDIVSKIHVAMTCHAEKSLVESERIPWKTVILTVLENDTERGGVLTVKAENLKNCGFRKKFNFFADKENSIKNAAACVAFIFKTSHVETLGISEKNEIFPKNFLKQLEKTTANIDFDLKNLWSNSGISPIFLKFFHEKSAKFLEKIRIDGVIPANFDTICAVKNLQFGTLETISTGILVEIVRRWIKNDAPVGTRMLFARQGIHNFGDTVRRLVGKDLNGTEFRIRKGGEGAATIRNNKRKSVVIREEEVGSEQFVSCVVIPTNLKASKYEKAENWIWKDDSELWIGN